MLMFLKILFIILIAVPGWAATYYIPDNYADLAAAFSGMSGGDTLILRDDTYTGANNQIRYNNKPPSGSVGNYTTIQAETVGGVILDGQDTRAMLDGTGTFTMSYVIIEGIQFVNRSGGKHDITGQSSSNRSAHHIKILKCGFEDRMYIYYAEYILVEDCYVVGEGRYGFMAQVSNNIVFRRCVVRLDQADGGGQPISHFMNYAATDVEFQNCIAIDSDSGYYTDYEGVYGGFYVRKRYDYFGLDSVNTKIRGSIVLNVQHGSPSEALSLGRNSYGTEIEHSVWWDIKQGMVIDNSTLTAHYIVDHCTFGMAAYDSDTRDNKMLDGNPGYGNVSNSIFYQITNPGSRDGIALSDVNLSTNNSFYGNDINKSSVSTSTGDITTVDPIDGSPGNGTAALKYLLQIEAGSDLDGAADDAGDIGATILKKIGTSGTFHGDSGYNTTTGDDLWPWPYEDTIRTFFIDYGAASSPSPDRGFCASGETLSDYIWEYLGNVVNGDPPDVSQSVTVIIQ